MRTTNRIRRKDDVQTHYDHGHRTPALNIKVYADCTSYGLERRWKGTQIPVKHAYLDKKRGDLVYEHEFGDPADPFWEWFDNVQDSAMLDNMISQAFDIACEIEYGDFKEWLVHESPIADWITAKDVWTEGRSGGWCCVGGLPEVEEWDAVMLAKWRAVAKMCDLYVEDVQYQVLWHLVVNGWESLTERMVAAL